MVDERERGESNPLATDDGERQRYRRVYDKAKTPAERLLLYPEVSEEDKQRIKTTAEECNFVKISVKIKVMLDKFHERLARRENIYD